TKSFQHAICSGSSKGLSGVRPSPLNTETKMAIPFNERLYCTIDEAAEAIGACRSKIYDLINNGRSPARQLYVRKNVVVASLLALPSSEQCAALSGEPGQLRAAKNKTTGRDAA